MRKRISVVLAAGLLLGGASAALAAGMQPSNFTMSRSATEMLSLSNTQQQTAWKDLYMGSLNQTSSSFNVKPGAVLPSSIVTAPVTPKAAGDVPALKPFNFAMVNGKLVIVNPSNKKIVEVISG
jgi:hypothetical protein